MARAAIDALKFHGIRTIADPLARLIARNISSIPLPHNLVLVSLPLYRTRLSERGFNQAEILTQAISHYTGLAMISESEHALVRIRTTAQQATLTKEKRLVNVTGAFAVPNPELVAGKTILVVDDVVTTGATMSDAARALLEAGARSVWAAAAAQG